MEQDGSPVMTLIVALIFCAAGILGIIFRAPLTRFFHDAGSSLWGRRIGDYVYTQRNLMWGFVFALIAGIVFAVIAIVRLAGG